MSIWPTAFPRSFLWVIPQSIYPFFSKVTAKIMHLIYFLNSFFEEKIELTASPLLTFDVSSSRKPLHSYSKNNPTNPLGETQLDASNTDTHMCPLAPPHPSLLQIVYNWTHVLWWRCTPPFYLLMLSFTQVQKMFHPFGWGKYGFSARVSCRTRQHSIVYVCMALKHRGGNLSQFGVSDFFT